MLLSKYAHKIKLCNLTVELLHLYCSFIIPFHFNSYYDIFIVRYFCFLRHLQYDISNYDIIVLRYYRYDIIVPPGSGYSI